jgi:hypothetical protein
MEIVFINLPVGLATLFFLTRANPSSRREAPFDGWGQLTAVVAMGPSTYGAIAPIQRQAPNCERIGSHVGMGWPS